jgi:hypothetical protein
MGDRTYTTIEFTGDISEEQAAELVAELEGQGCSPNNYGSEDLLEALKAGDSFYDMECNYATMEGVESWCGENEVGYLKTWAAGGDYGPGIELWKPGMKSSEQCASLEGEPIATLDDLIKARDAGKVDDLINNLKRFTTLGPPLRVLAVKDWTPELCVFMAKRKLEVE